VYKSIDETQTVKLFKFEILIITLTTYLWKTTKTTHPLQSPAA